MSNWIDGVAADMDSRRTRVLRWKVAPFFEEWKAPSAELLTSYHLVEVEFSACGFLHLVARGKLVLWSAGRFTDPILRQVPPLSAHGGCMGQCIGPALREVKSCIPQRLSRDSRPWRIEDPSREWLEGGF